MTTSLAGTGAKPVLQLVPVSHTVSVVPVQVMVVSMGVMVASPAGPVSGSSVKTLAKLEPETVPWLLSWLAPGGLLIVTWNLMVTLLLPLALIGRVPTVTLAVSAGSA